MPFQIHAGLEDCDAFALEEFFLKRGVRFADEDFPICSEHAVPGNALALRSGAHGAASAASAATEAQGSSEGPIG